MAKKEKKPQEPQYYMSATNTAMMNYRVYVMKPFEKILFMVALFVVGGLVGQVFYGGLFSENGEATMLTTISNIVVFAVVGLIAVKVFLPVVTEMLRTRRIKALKNQFRDFLAALSTSLSSGMNVPSALINAKRDLEMQHGAGAFIVKEVDEMIVGTQNNIPVESLISEFGKRSGCDDISNFAIVFSTCYRTGGNLKDVIRRTSDIISQKIQIADEIETKLTSNKMQMYVMLVIPVVVVLMMKTMSSEFAASFTSIIGVVATTVSIAMFVAAYKIGQKITDIK